MLLAPDFYQPMRGLAGAWHDRADAGAVAEELAFGQADEGLAIPGQEVRVTALPGPSTVSWRGAVTVKGAALPDIEIGAGENVALVGQSGAGKTPVLRLMAGLEPMASGKLLVAGHSLSNRTADAWRARIGWMPQAVHFLNESLGANLRLAVADRVTTGLPLRLLTRLGENGAGLSGGEVRRITLARALS